MRPVVRAQLDYYAVLEITPAAGTAEVNAAFRRLAWRCHPDRNHAPGATLQFQDINEAHQVLSDPIRRAEYDDRWHRRPTRVHVTPPPARHRYRRRWHRHTHLRVVMLSIAVVLFVSSAWAMIFTAMTAARSSGWSYTYDYPAGAVSHVAPGCGFSMEIFPVSYIDQNGQLVTAWETEVRNCYGGTTRLSSLSNSPAPTRFALDSTTQN